jgi:mono/diheme cytochrome c family protein
MFGPQLTEPDLRAVVEYVKHFSRKWRHEENFAPPVKVPAEPDWWSDNTERTRHAAAGHATFTATCATCHGEKADGTGPSAASLKDEWGQPITPANLRAPTLRSGNEPRDLYRVLLTGIGGTPMVSFAETFTDEQRWDLVAYLQSLRDSSIGTTTATTDDP